MIEIGDEYSSTSSIMPQKKNPDVAEIARAKSATITGELVTVLTINKSLPQSYNRDLQEISPHLWRAVDTAHDTINITRNMIGSVEFKKDRGQYLARSNFSTATELADLMVREKNIPFRLAHQIVGRAVSISLERGMKAEDMTNVFLDEISIEIIGKPLKLDETLIEQALDPHKVVESRKVTGGPSPEMVKNAINNLKLFIENSS
jgi:argininosuccinate lyase